MGNKTIAFFPEAAFGPALNSVGIAQACEKLGHKAVFLTDPGMQGVYSVFRDFVKMVYVHWASCKSNGIIISWRRFYSIYIINHISNYIGRYYRSGCRLVSYRVYVYNFQFLS